MNIWTAIAIVLGCQFAVMYLLDRIRHKNPSFEIRNLKRIDKELGDLKDELEQLQESAALKYRNMCKDCPVVATLEAELESEKSHRAREFEKGAPIDWEGKTPISLAGLLARIETLEGNPIEKQDRGASVLPDLIRVSVSIMDDARTVLLALVACGIPVVNVDASGHVRVTHGVIGRTHCPKTMEYIYTWPVKEEPDGAN